MELILQGWIGRNGEGNFGFLACHENYTIFKTREYNNVITIKERKMFTCE